MPTTKKRINLTVPEAVYEKLVAYKEENGLTNDATACLQLIVQQLKSQETGKFMMRMMQELSMDQLMQLSHAGYFEVKAVLDKAEEQ